MFYFHCFLGYIGHFKKCHLFLFEKIRVVALNSLNMEADKINVRKKRTPDFVNKEINAFKKYRNSGKPEASGKVFPGIYSNLVIVSQVL